MNTFKNKLKKVVTLGVGASMLGATLLGATASPYDLSDYPSPFVMDGMFNGLMVVGDDAAPADIIGVTDIAMSLQYSSTVTETIQVSGDNGVELGGDSVKIQRSGDVLELNEYLGGVAETLDAGDAEALKSFTIANDKGTTDVNQYLRFNWGTTLTSTTQKSASAQADSTVAKVIYSKDDDDNVGDFLWFKDGEEAFKYEMEFVEGFTSDNSSNNLLDFEDETLHILGEDFNIVDATHSANKLTLKLMGGAIHDTIEEGETKTYTLKGKEYEVTALIISDWAGASGNAKVKLKVNGEVTKELSEGSTEILNDGTSIGIREVLPNEAGETAGGDIMEFYLGAFKIEFTDNNTTSGTYDAISGDTVKVNEETIEDAKVNLEYTIPTANEVRINKITYYLLADGVSGDEPYIAPGQGLREKLDEPEGLLSDVWDFRYEGLSDPGVSMVRLRASGDDEYRLTWTNTQGIEYSNMRFLHSNATGNMVTGDDDDNMVWEYELRNLSASTDYTDCQIKKNDYFVVAHNPTSTSGVSRVLRFDSVDTSNSLVQLTDVGTGGAINAQYTQLNNTATGDVINVGGYSFDFVAYNTGLSGKDAYRLCVDLDDNGAIAGYNDAQLVIQGGGIIDLSHVNLTAGYGHHLYRPDLIDANHSNHNMTLMTKDTKFDEDPGPHETVVLTITESSGELDVDVVSNATIGLTFKTDEDNSDLKTGMTNYGVFITEMNEDNDPDTVEIQYPLGQLLPQVFVTFDKSISVEGGAGSITVERPQRIEIGSAVLASQVADPTAVNVISVGGPCINSVSAEVMGLTYPACGADSGLSEGDGIIRLYESGEKVAIVVAGWEAEDTTRATRVLSDFATYQEAGQLVGNEVQVTGTSATEFTVTPVSSAAPAAPAEEETEEAEE